MLLARLRTLVWPDRSLAGLAGRVLGGRPTCYHSRGTFRSIHYRNDAGIYHLQDDLQTATFGKERIQRTLSKAEPDESLAKSHLENKELQELALLHLQSNNLLNQETMKPSEIKMDIPGLVGPDLDQHFQKIGRQMSQPYLDLLLDYLHTKENFPIDENHKFKATSGWVRYSIECPEGQKVDFPHDDVITFDTEVMYEVHPYAVMATAISGSAYYVWLSPWLLDESDKQEHLIPLGDHLQVVIGHSVSFDRKRVKEEYNIRKSNKWFLDTMSLHIAVNGMCNQQRNAYAKFEKLRTSTSTRDLKICDAMLKKEPWLVHTSGNGLDDTCEYHLGVLVDKSDRDAFKSTDKSEINNPKDLQRLIHYCLNDSILTKQLCKALLPKFLSVNPHPVSFGALRHIASVFLPISEEWEEYVNKAEQSYQQKKDDINVNLHELADEAVSYIELEDGLELVENDPWLSQLDWTVKPIRYTKEKPGKPSRPMKNQKLPGKPEWYRELFTSKGINLTSRTRTTTILLRLKWQDCPLVWYDKLGWSFWAQDELVDGLKRRSLTPLETNNGKTLFKLPHPDGDSGRCTYPFAKFYLPYFEDKTITSDNKLAKEAIETNLQCSYWLSARQRILSQMPVYKKGLYAEDKDSFVDMPANWGMILPRMLPIGAVTRRAVEDTWLTASNAKKNKIGSELKSNVKAPPGYKIIGADVDSEELWIAGVVADSIFKMHGGTAIGWMTLEGTKQAKTDLHSKSADILGISRNDAKTFNYGRIYGAGQTSAARNLRLFNPNLSVKEAEQKAQALYSATKGDRFTSKHFPLKLFWYGGSESVMYNQLELLAQLPRQRTPVLGSGISDALSSQYLTQSSSFMTTRTNWTIQSSGVDYLHLLIASMEYLCDVHSIDARLLITVHDEVRYLVKEEDQYRAALALQIANLWTRGMFCQQLGFDCIPYSVAFFSAIDIDHVLRKEVNDPCITVTHPEPIPSGESLDIHQLLDKCSTLGAPDMARRLKYQEESAHYREPVMANLNKSPVLSEYIRAQTGNIETCEQLESELDTKYSKKTKRTRTKKSKSSTLEKAGPSSARGKVRLPVPP